LVVGSGAREHALAWRISQSPQLRKLYCAPGNPGTEAVATNVPLPSDAQGLLQTVRQLDIGLVVIGPEAPLVAGWTDVLIDAGVATFGPTRAAAALEGSKAFAKEVMHAAGVPTARSRSFDSSVEAEAYVRTLGPCVVKVDGLAAGKGVVVARTIEEANDAIPSLRRLGDVADRLIVEELLTGREASLIALCDGERYQLFPAAEDHKQLRDADQGPNTGGMGAYAPVASLAGAQAAALGEAVIAPVLSEMRRRGTPFRGALFAGLMLTPQGPRVLEYNCRFGDPETQALMMLLDEDLLPLLQSAATGHLPDRSLKCRAGAALGVVLASEGYPEKPLNGREIRLGSLADGVQVFHAGTVCSEGRLRTQGGRVLTLCAQGADLTQARASAYAALEQVGFQGMQYRRDIGARAS
jgi:phosphoribosylamine--glycine ligase